MQSHRHACPQHIFTAIIVVGWRCCCSPTTRPQLCQASSSRGRPLLACSPRERHQRRQNSPLFWNLLPLCQCRASHMPFHVVLHVSIKTVVPRSLPPLHLDAGAGTAADRGHICLGGNGNRPSISTARSPLVIHPIQVSPRVLPRTSYCRRDRVAARPSSHHHESSLDHPIRTLDQTPLPHSFVIDPSVKQPVECLRFSVPRPLREPKLLVLPPRPLRQLDPFRSFDDFAHRPQEPAKRPFYEKGKRLRARRGRRGAEPLPHCPRSLRVQSFRETRCNILFWRKCDLDPMCIFITATWTHAHASKSISARSARLFNSHCTQATPWRRLSARSSSLAVAFRGSSPVPAAAAPRPRLP